MLYIVPVRFRPPAPCTQARHHRHPEPGFSLVGRGRLELPTNELKVRCSTRPNESRIVISVVVGVRVPSWAPNRQLPGANWADRICNARDLQGATTTCETATLQIDFQALRPARLIMPNMKGVCRAILRSCQYVELATTTGSQNARLKRSGPPGRRRRIGAGTAGADADNRACSITGIALGRAHKARARAEAFDHRRAQQVFQQLRFTQPKPRTVTRFDIAVRGRAKPSWGTRTSAVV